MNILVTGAKEFVGRNLVETLKCIRDGMKSDVELEVDEVCEYDIDSSNDRYIQSRTLPA